MMRRSLNAQVVPEPDVSLVSECVAKSNPLPLVIDPDHQANGATQTAGLGHISYLLRMYELYYVRLDPDSTIARVEPIEGAPVFKPEVSQHWTAMIGTLMFFCVWIPCKIHGMNAQDGTLLPLLASFLTMYLLVYISTDFAMYESQSFVDGWNTITRFTTKLESPPGRTTFYDANVPCSISSSVSTRGSTLNKLMISVTFCLGTCLFMKFIQGDDKWTTLIAFGYGSLIFTGLYENRTFNLDASSPPFQHHRRDVVTLRGEGPITAEEQENTECYDRFHLLGVLGFVIATFIGQTGWYCSTPIDMYQPWQDKAWWLALTSVLLAAVFGVLNHYLSMPINHASSILHHLIAGTTTAKKNKLRGLTCITTEMLALMCATAAGFVSQVVPVAVITQLQ